MASGKRGVRATYSTGWAGLGQRGGSPPSGRPQCRPLSHSRPSGAGGSAITTGLSGRCAAIRYASSGTIRAARESYVSDVEMITGCGTRLPGGGGPRAGLTARVPNERLAQVQRSQRFSVVMAAARAGRSSPSVAVPPEQGVHVEGRTPLRRLVRPASPRVATSRREHLDRDP